MPLPAVRGGWLSEEMGLGKTIEVLAVINANRALPDRPAKVANRCVSPLNRLLRSLVYV